MMVRQLFVGATACLMLAAPVWAINKCTGTDGKVSFQDAPCASGTGEKVEVRLSSSGVDTAAADRPAPAASAASATAAASRKEGAFGPSWRRKTDLEQRLIREARSDLQTHQQRCEADLRDLSTNRTQARTATSVAKSEQTLAAEMQAAAMACDERARKLQANLESLEKELRDLNKK